MRPESEVTFDDFIEQAQLNPAFKDYSIMPDSLWLRFNGFYHLRVWFDQGFQTWKTEISRLTTDNVRVKIEVSSALEIFDLIELGFQEFVSSRINFAR